MFRKKKIKYIFLQYYKTLMVFERLKKILKKLPCLYILTHICIFLKEHWMHKDDLQISEKIFYDELFTRLCIKSKYNIHNKTV